MQTGRPLLTLLSIHRQRVIRRLLFPAQLQLYARGHPSRPRPIRLHRVSLTLRSRTSPLSLLVP